MEAPSRWMHESLRVMLVLWACAWTTACPRSPSNKTAAPKQDVVQNVAQDVVALSDIQIRNAGVVVRTITPELWKPHLTIPVQFVADPKHIAKVGPRMAGRVTKIHVELGDQVRAGQILLEMDTVEFHKTSMEYLVSIARTEEAKLALNRALRAEENGVGTVAEKERAEANARAADAQMKEAEEHLHALGLSDKDIARIRTQTTHGQEHTHVVAPMTGRVISVDVTLGKVVSGTEELLTISDVSEVWAMLRVYERDLGTIHIGTPIDLSVTAYGDKVIHATIDFISDLIEPATRTVEARARIRNADLKKDNVELRPGMTGRATVSLSSGDKTVMLPYEAVQTIEGEPSVFIETRNKTFQRRAVAVGSEYGGLVPVHSGIQTGDRVVVAGSLALAGELEKVRTQSDGVE